MLNSEKIIGIDLVRIEGDQGVYGIYQSVDGGSEWEKLTEASRVYELLDYAKGKFSDTTPMVIPQQIQSILRYEIMEDAAAEKLKLEMSKAEAVKPKTNTVWWRRLFGLVVKRK
tara:strand:- start:1255 stop:1596 length:342 start_codon:yes stop_codon:yes gene_type:complete